MVWTGNSIELAGGRFNAKGTPISGSTKLKDLGDDYEKNLKDFADEYRKKHNGN